MKKSKKRAGLATKLMACAASAVVLLSGCAVELDKEQVEDFVIHVARMDEAKAELSDEEILEKVSQSVVKIKHPDEEDFSGIGVIVSENGYIVANAKILGTENEVVTQDGTVYRAELIKTFPRGNLALIKIEAEGLVPVEIVNSADLQKGDAVVMVKNFVQNASSGNVIRGTISSTSENGTIQTDMEETAADANSLLLSSSGQIVGISCYENPETGEKFASIDEMIDYWYLTNPLVLVDYYHEQLGRIGLISGLIVSDIQSKQFSVPHGLLVQEIDDESLLIGKDVLEGDIITNIDYTEFDSFAELFYILDAYAPGEEVELMVYRQQTKRYFEVYTIIQ